MEPQGPTHIFLLSAFSTAYNTLQMVSPSKAEAADSRGKVVGLLSGLFFPPGCRGGRGLDWGSWKYGVGAALPPKRGVGGGETSSATSGDNGRNQGSVLKQGHIPKPLMDSLRELLCGWPPGLGRKSPQHFQGWEKSTIQ